MIVTCCKCFHRTRKFKCPKCGHKVCTSCKEVVRANVRRTVSKTPRTDAAATDGWSGDAAAVPVEFAQNLELEIKELKRQLRNLRRVTR